MTRKNKGAAAPGLAGIDPTAGGPRKDAAGQGNAAPESEIKTNGWTNAEAKPLRKDFPDSNAVDEPLRIALTAEASAEIANHAKESLDAEVCGVLVGHACEDDAGPWVWVKAAIRGDAWRGKAAPTSPIRKKRGGKFTR